MNVAIYVRSTIDKQQNLKLYQDLMRDLAAPLREEPEIFSRKKEAGSMNPDFVLNSIMARILTKKMRIRKLFFVFSYMAGGIIM